MTYLITIEEETPYAEGTLGSSTDKPKSLEIYRQRVTEIDLNAVIQAINKTPRSDKGGRHKKPAEGGAK